MNTTQTQDLSAMANDYPVVLVTGGSRRIGASIVRYAHQAGYDVAIHYHQSQETARALVDELNQIRPQSAGLFQADLSQQAEATLLIQSVWSWKKRLDSLVNNASCFMKTPLAQYDEAIWQAHDDLHVKAPFWLTMAARPHLLASKHHPNVINITDIHAEKPLRSYLAYVQSKAALSMQTIQLAKELAPHIRVNAVAPGATIPPEGENALDEQTQANILNQIALKKWGAPKWIAQTVVFLMCNAYITGQIIKVDGGRGL